MPRSLLYLLARQMIGSWRFRLQRLKQPKYLVGALVSTQRMAPFE